MRPFSLKNDPQDTRHQDAIPYIGSHPPYLRRVNFIPLPALLWLLTVMLLFSGCVMLGPDFVTPEAPVSDKWLETGDPKLKSEPTDSTEWWRAFKDPVLNDLVERAYKQNLPLQIAGLRILEARANLGIAYGNIYPQRQQLSGLVSNNQLSKNGSNLGILDRSHTDFFIGFDAAWEIDFWGRFRRGIESADAELIASIANYDDFLVSLTAEVARTYVLIRTFQERIELAQENIQIQKRSLEIAEVRFRNGVVTELDVTQAKSLLRDTQALIPRLEAGLRRATNALSILLGIPPSDPQHVMEGEQVIPTVPANVAVGIPTELLRRRPDIRRAELAAAAQSARIGIARSDLFPRIALLGSIGLQSSEGGGILSNNADFVDLFDVDSVTYFLGPRIDWPILNYGRLKNNVRVQDARLQKLIVNYQNTVLKAAQEVEDGLIAFLRTQDEVGFLSDSVTAAKRSVKLSLIQYREGIVDYQRVLTSQQFLVQEQDRWTATRGEVALHLVSTYKALGGGWQIRQDKDFVPIETQQVMRERTDWGDLLKPAALDVPPPAEAGKSLPIPDF
jgi:NodT family efflux transporter outer membrane factor (OMF) lipoprotein